MYVLSEWLFVFYWMKHWNSIRSQRTEGSDILCIVKYVIWNINIWNIIINILSCIFIFRMLFLFSQGIFYVQRMLISFFLFFCFLSIWIFAQVALMCNGSPLLCFGRVHQTTFHFISEFNLFKIRKPKQTNILSKMKCYWKF